MFAIIIMHVCESVTGFWMTVDAVCVCVSCVSNGLENGKRQCLHSEFQMCVGCWKLVRQNVLRYRLSCFAVGAIAHFTFQLFALISHFGMRMRMRADKFYSNTKLLCCKFSFLTVFRVFRICHHFWLQTSNQSRIINILIHHSIDPWLQPTAKHEKQKIFVDLTLDTLSSRDSWAN